MTTGRLDVAWQILQTLGRCECDEISAKPLDYPSFLARQDDPFTGQTQKRVLLAADASHIDVDHWMTVDPPDISVLILTRNEEEDLAADALRTRVVEQGRGIEILGWSTFVSRFVGLGRIQRHYRKLRDDYRHTEGDDFIYIDPTVIDEDDRRSWPLAQWAVAHERAGGVVYLVADYGEGKTSFCLDYVFRIIDFPGMDGGVPLLFTLNACQAGSVESFVIERLWEDYGLPLTFAAFQSLCQAGIFLPVFDAFDQMPHNTAGGLRIERDHGAVLALRSDVTPLYLTCRLDFYNRYLQPTSDPGALTDDRRRTQVLTLKGFGDAEVHELLGDRPEHRALVAVLNDPASLALLAGIHRKPLILRVIIRHFETFDALLTERRRQATGAEAGRRRFNLTEYDIFNLLYENWLEWIDDNGYSTRDEAIRICRALTARAQLDSLNLALPFARLADDKACAELLSTVPRREGVLEDFWHLPLLDQAQLQRQEQPIIVFRFNAYLEFLTARFVLDELRGEELEDRAFVKNNVLTWETRQMLGPLLDVDFYGEKLRRVLEETRLRHFRDVEYQGGNALTLVLDRLQAVDLGSDDRGHWRELLRSLKLPYAVLRRVDARGADLAHLDFSHCDLVDADFSYAVLRGARFAHADLEGARFLEAGALLTAAFIRREGADGAGWRLVGGTEAGLLVFWDSTEPYPTRSRTHQGAITALDMRGQPGRVYSVSLDGALCETRVDDPSAVRRYPLGIGSLRTMTLTEDGQTVFVAGDRRMVQVVDFSIPRFWSVALPPGEGAVVTQLALDEPACQLYVGDSDGALFMIEGLGGWLNAAPGHSWAQGAGGPVRSLIALAQGGLLAVREDGQAVTLDDQTQDRHDGLDGERRDAVCYAREIDTVFWLEGQRLMRQGRSVQDARPEPIGQLTERLENFVLTCAPDGSFIAAGGERLVVWASGRFGLQIVREESMLMDCRGMILDRCKGLSDDTLNVLVKRGAEA